MVFKPNINSVVISLFKDTKDEELELIKGFYKDTPIELVKHGSGGLETITFQLDDKYLDLDKMIDVMIELQIPMVLFTNTDSDAVLAMITNDGPQTTNMGKLELAESKEENYLLCVRSGRKWTINPQHIKEKGTLNV